MVASVAHVVFPAVAFFFFLAFLAVLVALGRLAASATQGPADGKRGCLGGCALFCVLAFLCLLGIAGFAAFACMTAAVTAVEHNPVRSVELIHAPEGHPASRSGGGGDLVLRFEVQGSVEPLIELVKRRFDLREEDLRLAVHRGAGEDGRDLVELWVPLDSRDVEDLRRELEEAGWELPGGLRVKLRDSGYPR